MSNRFYNYVTDELVKFFEQQSKREKIGRYYLQLPSKDISEIVYNILRAQKETNDFTYQHEYGNEEFVTIALHFEEKKFVIAMVTEKISPSFLVTLRNAMSLQRGNWKNASLVLLTSSLNDSIKDGGTNLVSEGMPLYVENFIENLEDVVREKVANGTARRVIEHFLSKREREYKLDNTSFLDFEDVLDIANKKEVSSTDYKELQYFPDADLKHYLSEQELVPEESKKWRDLDKKIEKRLDLNNDLHHDIEKIRELGTAKEDLENHFGNGKDELSNEDKWYKTDFTQIIKWKDEVEKTSKIVLYDNEIKPESKDVALWKRPKTSKGAGLRDWHFIAFLSNENKEEFVDIVIPFSSHLSKNYIKKSGSHLASTSGKQLKLRLPVISNSNTYRVTYEHEYLTSMKYVFHILLLRDEPSRFESIRHQYLIHTSSKKDYALHINTTEARLEIGKGLETELSLSETNQVVSFEDDEKLIINIQPTAVDEDKVKFYLQTETYELPILIQDKSLYITPMKTSDIWLEKYNTNKTLEMNDDMSQVYIRDFPHSTYTKERYYFELEKQWVNEGIRYGVLIDDIVIEKKISLPEKVEDAYVSLLNSLSEQKSPLIFVYYDEQLRILAENYLKAFMNEIEKIEPNAVLNEQQRNLLKIGRIDHLGSMYFTSLSPSVLAHILYLQECTEGEKIDRNIMKRLSQVNLAPFIVNNNELYKPQTHDVVPEWIEYKLSEEVTVQEANQFLAHLVEEKINQFKEYYSYLFNLSHSAPIRLNIVEVPDDHEILRGIVNLLLKQIKSGKELVALSHFEVTAYLNTGISSFENFNQLTDFQEAEAYLNLLFTNKFELSRDVLSALQRVIQFSKKTITNEINYSHISFYKMGGQEHVVQQMMHKLPDSLSMNGLLVSRTASISKNAGYRLGFGRGNYTKNNESAIEEFIVLWNEYLANMMHGGNNPYSKEISIATKVHHKDEDLLEKLYEKSHWVTFINPEVDMQYFTNHKDDLIVVHYSDQLTSSNSYDAITVTNKSNQYIQVIKDFLKARNVTVSSDSIPEVIRAFNVFNGEWLLRAVQNKSHDQREKLSVLSAVKQSLRYFIKKAPEVIWIPISMEEIVRVSNAVQLNKKDGIFSGKTVGRRGNCSDDLLMMGLEISDDDVIKVHLYPVEVKIGINEQGVINKGIIQVKELKSRLHDYLQEESFDGKFLRNFFMQRLITNAKKMEDEDYWPERDEIISQELESRLLNNDFLISHELSNEFGKGVILSYKKDMMSESEERIQGVIVLTYPEQAGYELLTMPMSDVIELRSFNYRVIPIVEKDIPKTENKLNDIIPNTVDEPVVEITDKPIVREDPIDLSLPKTTRPFIGNTTQDIPIYWEYNHSSLANRHLLIGGRSGQGKTYFIQSLLMDLNKSNHPALIIDYSSSYTPHQLEDEFKEVIGKKLHERIVYSDKFPLNPFVRREKEIAGRVVGLEQPSETATRVADVFASVYHSFGSQQKSALYSAIKKGIEIYEDKMRMTHLVEQLEALEGYTSAVISSIISRIIQFVHIDPFDYESKQNWNDYFNEDGQLTIIQLDGYDQIEIKKLMTEFILWDLWYFTLNRTKDQPISVVLDEAQNLDFSEASPANRILREGRKFGWSAWFATQSFSNFKKEEMAALDNTATKVYFNPAESEVGIIASRMGLDNQDVLRRLQKGQCLVSGQFESDGILSKPTKYIVQVPPMSERE